MAHRYYPAGLGRSSCGICQREMDDKIHAVGMKDAIGADATQCPGCEEIWPVEMTVRMLRFVRPDGKELGGRNLRVCHECAGMPVDDWALLALRHERGWITEDRYVERLQELATRTETEAPRICGAVNWMGTCCETRAHPGAHRYTAVKAQKR